MNATRGIISLISLIPISLMLILGFCDLSSASESAKTGEGWRVHTINAESPYEAAGIGDINNDGQTDIVSGAYWYQAPDWRTYQIAELEEINGYYNDFANELMDVDHDGDLDIVNCAWFSQSVFWRENPGEAGGLWPTHTIDKAGNMETGFLFDFNQDGLKDFIPNIMTEVAWFKYHPPSVQTEHPTWHKHSVGVEGKGHGLGFGDVNSDGINDFVCPGGWYETAKDGKTYQWTWHGEFQLGTASVPIEIHDVNGDGLKDIVWGMGHDYGLFWLEQSINEEQRQWTRHEIDTSWSQAHYIKMVDIDNDGQKELLAGKRYWAHNGGDPGAKDPLGIYIYTYNQENQSWERQPIHEGGKVGFGLNPAIGDVDGDGDLDIIASGKSGLYWLENRLSP